jgi:hypothetical protein
MKMGQKKRLNSLALIDIIDDNIILFKACQVFVKTNRLWNSFSYITFFYIKDVEAEDQKSLSIGQHLEE